MSEDTERTVSPAAPPGNVPGQRTARQRRPTGAPPPLPHPVRVSTTAWLVLACDLPFLSDATIEGLLKARDVKTLATAYTSAHDGLPEPLCAIWEPRAAAALDASLAAGGRCPRKFLLRSDAALLEPSDRRALDNVNTPEEYASALTALGD